MEDDDDDLTDAEKKKKKDIIMNIVEVKRKMIKNLNLNRIKVIYLNLINLR